MNATLARILTVVAAVLLVATTISVYLSRALFDPERFADRAVAALQDPSVRDEVADRITDDIVIEQQPDLLAVRPVVAEAVSGVVGGRAFATLFRGAVRDVHAAVFQRDQDTVALALVDVGIVAREALRALDPAVAARFETDDRVALLREDIGAAGGDLARLARQARLLAWVVGLLALAAAAGSVLLSADRRRAVARLGIATAAAGVVVVAAEVLARALVLDRVAGPEARDAAGGVWDAFLGDLRATGWLVAGTGALVAAAAASSASPVSVGVPLRAAWRAVATEPVRPVWAIARGFALIAGGVAVVAEPAAAARIAATVVGVAIVYAGAEAILRVIGPAAPRAAPERTKPARGWRRLAVPAVAAVAILAAFGVFATAGGVDAPAQPLDRCNGHAALCDRPLPDVTVAATHNAMSVPLPGWFASLQERPIPEQLEAGVRGLLLDTHYADLLPNHRVRTFFPGGTPSAVQEDSVSEESVRAAQRLRERLGFRGEGERGMYLCHTFCELGATPLEEVLAGIHTFLVTHPAEVVTIVNQDYVTPADFVGAMDDAGLSRFAFTPPAGDDWPTLREMIEDDTRLLVLAENEAGAAPWYQPAYERLVQETPFSFSQTSQLTDPATLDATCRPNRGTPGAPLFLVNHWINSDPLPRPANAAVVNAYDALLARARACERVRDHRVNLLAVDFYERGDVFEVVDALNGVSRGR